MKAKIAKLSYLFYILIIFSFFKINNIYSYENNLDYREMEDLYNSPNVHNSPNIKRLKSIFPKLNNKNLLYKVLKEILKEFDKDHYNLESKKNINEKITLLDKYNIIDEFSDVIEQTVYDKENCLFVFIGNRTDYINYNHYLTSKKQNFINHNGNFWRNWSPSNIEIVTKEKIIFLIDIFEEILILEEKLKDLNKQEKSIYLENITKLEQKIERYKTLFQEQQNFIIDKDRKIKKLEEEILENSRDTVYLNDVIREKNKALEEKEEELSRNKTLSLDQQEKLKSVIAKMKIDIQNISKNLQEKENSINSLTDKIREILIELRFKNEEIKYIQKEKTTFQTNIERKIIIIERLEKTLKDSQNIIDKLNKNLDDYKKKLDIKDQKINLLEERIQDNNEKIHSLDAEIKSKNIELENKEKELRKERNLSEEKIREINNKITDLKEQIKKLGREIRFQKFISKQNNIYIQELLKQITDKDEEIKEIKNVSEKDKKNLQDIVESQKEKIEKLQTKLYEIDSYIEALIETIKKQEIIINDNKEEIKEIKENIEIKESIIFSLREKINYFSELIEQKNEEILNNNLLSEEEKKDLETTIENLKKDLDFQREQLNTKEDFIKANQTRIEFLIKKLSEKEREIEKIEKISEREKQNLTSKINSQIEELDEFKNRLTELQSQVDELNKSLEQQTKIIEKQEEKIIQLERTIEYDKSQIFELSNSILDIKRELENRTDELLKNKNLSEIQKKLLKKKIEDLEIELSDLTKEISSKEENLKQSKQKIEDLKRDLEKQQEKIEENDILNRKEKEKLEKKINGILSSLEDKKEDLEKYEKKIKDSIIHETAITKFVLSALEHIDNINDKTLNFLKKIGNEQENKKLNEMENVKSFLKKTDDFPSFAEVIGSDEAKKQLQESLNHLKNIKEYKKMGIKKAPKGILLYGPPGTGKTFLAEAFAKEAGLPFFCLTSDDFSKTYVGEGPRLIRQLFEEARKNSPSIILIDECEVAFKKRNSDGLNSDHGNIISAFLSEIEGVRTVNDKPVFVIGTTNFKDEIDSSIISRFNKLIKIDYWTKEDLKFFLSQISKKYKLDIRSYKYLEKISQMIIDSNLDSLRTPRKILELLEQAGVRSITEHQHLNILPIDLETSLQRMLNDKNINWQEHEHVKHDIEELFSITEYKTIPIKHVFEDSILTAQEKEFCDLIRKQYQINQKVVYNGENENQILEIEIEESELEKIKKFYSSINPLPEKLLGFYLLKAKVKNNSKEKNKKISSLEDILNEGVEKKVEKIYFVWDIKKNEYNKKIIRELIKIYQDKYNFLKLDNIFEKKINEIYKNIDNNKIELDKEIKNYIEQIKKELFDGIYNEIYKDKEILNYKNISELENEIKDKIETLFQNNIYSSLVDIKNEIIFDIKSKKIQDKKLFVKEKIYYLIEEMSFNEEIFTSQQIEKIKSKIKEETEKKLEILQEYSLKEIKKYLKEIETKHTKKLFQEKWKQIIQKIKINFNFNKEKIIHVLEKKAKNQLFYKNINLEEIIDILNREAEIQIQESEQNLNKAILSKINKSLLIDKILGDNIPSQDIDLINKGS
ncbi:MAG: AAA family ATPase, partial [Candidatus Phytoplasma stylosanthis]|nr:AAA family ATPase [Candidatus Phytoplasma stylosanthis]